jgi:inner membrane protein
VASLAHVVVGIAGARTVNPAARLRWRDVVTLVALSSLADLDVLAFRFGIPYPAPFGHRGATHSLVFAFVAGVIAAVMLARIGGRPLGTLMLVACAVAATHPILDAMTDGGLGVALLWPFSNERFFAPWRPIPVAPIGARMLSSRGLLVVWIELVACLPLLAWALWPRRRG